MAVKPSPEGYHTVTPYLIVPRVARLIEFLTRAFDAEERLRLPRPNGSIMHAEVRIGKSAVMMGEPMGKFTSMPASIYLYVKDCDAVYKRALEAGGTSVMEPEDQPHAGDRYGGVKDPSGNIWWIATHLEDLKPQEMVRRAEALVKRHRQGRAPR
jgi:uncharacterized glyoxalase superfamily protein PhnB